MTLNDLLDETYALGFEDAGEMSERFLFCANRAIRFICSAHSKECVKTIYVPREKTSYAETLRELGSGEEFTVKAKGDAYSFKICGSGAFSIKDGETVINQTFSEKNKSFRGFLKSGEATFSFFAASSVIINDFAVFESVFSKEEKDIPTYGNSRPIFLPDYIDCFSHLTRSPRDKDGNTLSFINASTDTLLLPRSFFGEIYIFYKEFPRALTLDDGDRYIPLPEFCEHLCPILTASYLWLDDDSEKAEYYMRIYLEESNLLSRRIRADVNSAYNDVTGW